jgi:formylglycine-generating enzyme required for sulfatase activity
VLLGWLIIHAFSGSGEALPGSGKSLNGSGIMGDWRSADRQRQVTFSADGTFTEYIPYPDRKGTYECTLPSPNHFNFYVNNHWVKGIYELREPDTMLLFCGNGDDCPQSMEDRSTSFLDSAPVTYTRKIAFQDPKVLLDRYKDAIKLSAHDFLSLYHNQLAGDDKYKDKLVTFTAIPIKLEDNHDRHVKVWNNETHEFQETGVTKVLGPPYALFTTSGKEESLGICCEFNDEDDVPYELSKGGSDPVDVPVTVVGYCRGIGDLHKASYSMRTVRLDMCAVLTSRDEIQAEIQTKAKNQADAAAKAEADAEQNVKDSSAVMITAAELENMNSGDREKLLGKVLEFSGTVHVVSEIGEEIIVDLTVKDLSSGAKCKFKAKYRSELAHVKPGQAVRIRGTPVAPFTYSTELKYCLLVKSSTAANAGAVPKSALNTGAQDIGADGKPRELALDLGSGYKLDMILIPAGDFLMGSPDSDQTAKENEKPQHRVRITKPFYIGKYLVTQGQWEAVMDPNYVKNPDIPVGGVSWDDCQKFFAKLNSKLGPARGKFGLPTEAQWEYACRAGSTTIYCFGSDSKGLSEYAWYATSRNGKYKMHPVGEKKPNAWGLYDMHGNVWEWCQDRYDEGYYAHSPVDDPIGPTVGSAHMVRGGCFRSPAANCRSAFRGGRKQETDNRDHGFRVSLVPAEK